MKSGGLAMALALSVAVLAGCGEDPEEAAFRQSLKDKALNDDNRRAGDAFMTQNAAVEGVVTLPSGLQYRVLREGVGRSPEAGGKVRVHYEGRLVDGTVFESSYSDGEPVELSLRQVIPGWREGMSLMREGGEWMLYVPPELAYGATSPSPDIPANSTLVFKVELLDVMTQ
ncbi:hypothetical protein GCM10011348_16710 [Marinobacterium nitratireducens]|uniref:Peptidyl-prolyl cis-trans isomerase n=1 Tax=Marinobacterium nitratireducens TaxID=518897 RepID=A0A918DSI0_9GAMM|nr:FKBP-type peptidyl-prolyl cis-trans isomerase [Marinobacterium nitratireducens]GGO80324.1 hypothetical protein GCM10011348_16710 [Marinobacterium nitratireducens]